MSATSSPAHSFIVRSNLSADPRRRKSLRIIRYCAGNLAHATSARPYSVLHSAAPPSGDSPKKRPRNLNQSPVDLASRLKAQPQGSYRVSITAPALT
ncbi:hypothetical protein RRG08_047469 [Elysia crispata]|uniref:Uncharacterized protein n=1 Tax=Elysia crispata TaxID=231223 RepID=A0AAE0YJR6_9GAST|nr:hypothetical protein RRG08_047469 [Elysia crispata]